MIKQYIQGDVLAAPTIDPDAIKIIPHCCNNLGGWGSGFVVALSNWNRLPENAYRAWHSTGKTTDINEDEFKLGYTQLVKVNDKTYVANMIGQNGMVSQTNRKPIKYLYLGMAMKRLVNHLQRVNMMHNVNSWPFFPAEEYVKKDLKFEIHCPKFGAGLAQGNWIVIEELINEIWSDYPVYVYEY